MRNGFVRLTPSGDSMTGSPGGGVPSAPLEPLMIDHQHTSEFGETPLGDKSIADLQNIMTNWDSRMKALSQAYADFSPTWVNQDHVSFVDWTADWTNLQKRYNAAVTAANNVITVAKFSPLPMSMIAAQPEYDGLAKAMRQCYPPDGCPVAKGDYDDLNRRLATAKGQTGAAVSPVMVQPTATDWQLGIFNALAPVDVLGGGGAPPSGPPKPTSAIKWLFIGAGLAVGGIVGAKIGGIIGGIGGMVGTLVGAAVGAGAVEVMSLEMASAGKSAKTAIRGTATKAAKSLLTP